MVKSIYLKKLLEQCNETRKPVAKKTLYSVILLAAIAIISYIGLPLLNTNAAPMATMLSVIFGLLAVIFLIRFIRINGRISNAVLMKCEKEIEKNLKAGENFETFDTDMLHPAYGEHIVNITNVIVGQTFVLFQRINLNGPSFNILRGDNLGDFDVHYFSQNGVGTDIGMDIKDKNGKFIRSITTPDKDQFYKFLNAMEKLKHHANGEEVPEEHVVNGEDDQFVQELKQKVKNTDKKGFIKLGILGIVMGIFLCIAGNSSGEGFIYCGLGLTILSIAFIIGVNVKLRN